MTKNVNNYSYWIQPVNIKNSRFTTPLPSSKFLRKYIPKNGKVLDLGCGYGRFTKLLVSLGYETIGIDISRPLIDRAKKLCPQARYRVISVQNYDPQIDCPFDAVFMMGVIENLVSPKERRDLAKKIYRSLNENGILFLETFVYDDRYEKDYIDNSLNNMPLGVFAVKRGLSKLILFHDTVSGTDKLFENEGLKRIYGKTTDFETWSGGKHKGYIAVYQKLKDYK